jgi:hypothetical protein
MPPKARRLSKAEAGRLIRACLERGDIILTKHFREELRAEDLTVADAFHVLQHGNVFNEPEFNPRYQDWNYRMEGAEPDGKFMAIVFAFTDDEMGLLVTIFRIKGI